MNNEDLKYEDLKYQVENYNSLDIWNSARGAAVIALISIAIVNAIFSHTIIKYWWIDIVVGLILGLFIYKGSKIALIITMIYWTVARFLQMTRGFFLGDTDAVMTAILFWGILIDPFLWTAYRVEKEREKLTPQNTAKKTAVRKVISNLLLLIIVLFTSYTFIHIGDEIGSCKNYRMLLQSSCVTSAVTSNLFYMLGLSVPMALLYFWIKPKK